MITYVGLTSRFTFTGNFSALDTNELLTVVSISSMDDLTSTGVDVYSTVYKPVGYGTTDYASDKALDDKIITLANTKIRLAVPESRLNIVNDATLQNQHLVSARLVAIDIGAMEVTEDIGIFLNEIALVTRNVLGIVPTIKEVETTRREYVATDSVNLWNSNRNILKASDDNTTIKIAKLEQEKLDLQALVDKLKCVVTKLNCN